jgi:hypothetical protein
MLCESLQEFGGEREGRRPTAAFVLPKMELLALAESLNPEGKQPREKNVF